MEYKNSVSWLLIGLLSTSAVAGECYIRSATTSKMLDSIERIADLERTVLPESKGKSKCRVTFRAYIKGKWHTAQGEEVAETWGSLDQACAKATTAGRVGVLESVSGTRITASQDMVCTDQPIPKDKPNVSIGDTVWESEVQPHPIHFDNFKFRGSLCRWFVESRPQAGTIQMSQGIICRAQDQLAWKVVDKW